MWAHLFIGHYSPEVIGDYVAGPSHVLPTNRTAEIYQWVIGQ